jgi:hypothetical protein
MAMRLRADIFVSAFLRRCQVENVFGALRKRGAAEAGAIFVKVDKLDGTAALYGPAPQTETAARGVDRLWSRLHKEPFIPVPDVEERLLKEQRFDPDLWIIEIEDREGRSFLDLAGEV